MSIATVELRAKSGQIRSATDDLRRLEQQGAKTDRAVKVIAQSFVALGGAAVIGSAIKTTAQFSQAIADLSAITGAAGADLKFYSEQAAEIGRTTTLSASQAADAFKLIASAQPQLLSNAKALAQVTKEAVALAEATGSTLPEAAQALGSALNQFQLDASEAGNIINVLAASSQLGTAEVANVTEALRNAGSAANSLGLDFAETVAGIQALAASGRQGADAGTALRQVLLRLEDAGDKRLQPSLVGLSGALDELASRSLTNTQLIDLFGQEAFTAATSLLAQRRVVDELNVSLRGTQTAYEQQSIRVNTFEGDLKALRSAIEALTIEALSDDVDGLGRSLVQAATDGVNKLTDNLDTLAEIGIAVAAVFGARMVGAVGTSTAAFIAGQIQAARYQAALASMAGVSRVTAANLTLLGAAATGASRAMAFLGGPVGVIALAVTALIYFSDEAETSKERSIRLSSELDNLAKSFDGLTAAQLRNEYNAQAAKAFVTLPADLARINKLIENQVAIIDDANRAASQGSGRESQYGVQSQAVAEATDKLNKLRQEAASLEEQILISERAVSNLGDSLATFNDGSRAAADSADSLTSGLKNQETEFSKLQDSILSQIIALQEGEASSERYQAIQRLGVDATEEEIAAIDALLGRLNTLRVNREAETNARRIAESFGGLQSDLTVETADDPETARLEQQLEKRLELINEYRMTKQADQAAADAAELAAFEALENEKLNITKKREAEARKFTISQTTATLSAFGNLFGNLAEIARNGGEESFGAYKALASAQAGIAAALAILQVYSDATIPTFLKLPLSVTIGALAATQIAQIQNAQYGGGRALGGQVVTGTSYLVGERGPELFTPSGGGGNITPFSQLMSEARQSNQSQAGTQNLSVNFAITANDSRGFDELLVKRRDLVYNMVQKALNDQGRRL
jgi:TP901 family phage tail tape measure protein